jgi:hypothetical protein
VPACTTTSGASDVLDDEHAVPPRELDEPLPPLGRERHARRVLVIRDRVEQLRPQAPLEQRRQRVDVEPVLVHRHRVHDGLERPERHDRPEIRRRLDHHVVAAVEERLRHQLERLDPAARHEQLVLRRPPVQPGGQHLPRTREPLGRRILEGSNVELRRQLGHALRRERARVGEAAREGDQLRIPEQPEDRRDAVTGAGTSPLRELPRMCGRHLPRT